MERQRLLATYIIPGGGACPARGVYLPFMYTRFQASERICHWLCFDPVQRRSAFVRARSTEHPWSRNLASVVHPRALMLSEYAAGSDGLGGGRALGFEPGHGGRSYGLEEVRYPRGRILPELLLITRGCLLSISCSAGPEGTTLLDWEGPGTRARSGQAEAWRGWSCMRTEC